jgi:hypothetical protein
MQQQHRPNDATRKAQAQNAQPTVGGINRLSPMNPCVFRALVTLYPQFMARQNSTKGKRYAMGVREIRQMAREDASSKVTANDVLLVCKVARVGFQDDLKAMQFLKGALAPVMQQQIAGKSVRDLVQLDFDHAAL